MRINLDIDRYKEKIENYVKEELVQNITAETKIKLIHDIFYKEDFKVYTNLSNKLGSKLEIAIDYDLEDVDEVATFDSQKLCYRKISFKENQDQVYIDYWVYGDTLTSEMINTLNERMGTVEEATEDAVEDIKTLGTYIGGVESNLNQSIENISAIDKRVTATEGDINNLKEVIDGDGQNEPGLNNRVGDLEEALNDEGQGLIPRVETIEDTLNGDGQDEPGLNNRVGDLEEALNDEGEGLIPRVKSIEDTLNGEGQNEPGLIEEVSINKEGIEAIAEILAGTGDNPGIIDKVTALEQGLNATNSNLGPRVESIEDTLNGDDQDNPGLINEIEKIKESLTDICYLKTAPDFASLPPTGREDTLYITRDDEKTYRWNGSAYISFGSSGSLDDGVIPSLYTFEIGDDGYLYVVYLEGSQVPVFEIDEEGYLWAIFEIEDEA